MTTERSTSWSVTINNPQPSDDEDISRARQKNWKVEGQLEQGKEGTKHYQLLVKTPQLRFSALKKAFPRAHIEVARNPDALAIYVNKEDTRIGHLQEQSEMYPSLSKLWDLFADWIDDKPYDVFNEEEWLDQFDLFIKDKITEGYHVETMGVNPQIRSAVKKYGCSIIFRSKTSVDRQTDRQPRSESQEVNLPVQL